MATWYLINNVQLGTVLKIAGELIDDAQEDATAIRNAGGILAPAPNATLAAASAIAIQKKLAGGTPEACEAVMMAALDVTQEMKETTPVADSAALAAIPALLRTDGMQAVKTDDDTIWVFDSTSTAGASAWVIVPAVGTGRWLRKFYTLSDLTGTAVYDGAPMQNRLRLANAGGGGAAIAAGDYVTIGTTLFEFRAVTPPVGGTAGRVWIYNGANVGESLANLIDAINHVVDAARINYNGKAGENVKAEAGVLATDLRLQSALTPGGTVCPSATALATTDNITDAADIWDAATMYGGYAAATRKKAVKKVTLTAAMITKGSIEVEFDFVPSLDRSFVENNLRKQNEAMTVVGNSLSLALAGGATPNNQAADVLTFSASE